MAEQSRIDRLKRLEDGRCPIHGIGMVQVGQDGALFRVECPRVATYRELPMSLMGL